MSRHLSEQEMQELDFTRYRLSRKQAIRLNCMDCMGFQEVEVKNCTIIKCPLYPYRMSGTVNVPMISLSKLKQKMGKTETKEE